MRKQNLLHSFKSKFEATSTREEFRNFSIWLSIVNTTLLAWYKLSKESGRFSLIQRHLKNLNFKPISKKKVSTPLWLGLIIFTSSALSTLIAQIDTTLVNGDYSKQESLFSIGLGAQHGFIFAHSIDVQNTKGARPTGIEATLSWQRNDAVTFALCHCYPRQGILLAYYDYDVDLLGKSATAAYFMEPTYRISNRLLFSFKSAAGFSYLNNPFDSISNPGNQSYSTHLSFYLRVGVGAWVQLSEQWWLNPNINYQHISNGGTSQPNKGINWPTAGLAVSYQLDTRPWHTGNRSTEKYWKDYSTRYDITLLGTMRRGFNEDGDRKRYPLVGVAFQAGRQVGNLSMLTLGAEAYYDSELKYKLRREGNQTSPTKAGVLFGHEFLLGRFEFSQRMGVYVFNKTPYFDQIFHRWGLQYRLNRQLSAGFNLLAHLQVAEFIDFRLTYTFKKRYE